MGARAREAESPRGGRALHNMSAPPRMRLRIRPLRRAETAGPSRDAPAPVAGAAGAGLQLIARLDPEALVRRAPDCGEETDTGQCRLAGLAGLALAAAGLPPVPPAILAQRSREQLLDILREAAARLDPRALGLPAIALVRRVSCEAAGVWSEPDIARGIVLLTRTVGSLFIASRSPRVEGLGAERGCLLFYLPGPLGAEESP